MSKPFFDTNVLLYAFAAADLRRHEARSFLALGGTFSVQVANEFVDVSRRKYKWSWSEVAAALDTVRQFLGPPIPLTDDIHRTALRLSARHHFRIYDSLLIGAAHQAGSRVIYSEDMQHGQTIEDVTIRNPFLPA